jgi:hypothetical protein
MPINYERAKRRAPGLKAALTRAQRKPLPERYKAVLAACKAAITEWREWGAWPDDWATWECALNMAASGHARETGEFPAITKLVQI